MKFSTSAALAACFASALANVALTNSDYSGIGEGKPFKLTWAGAEGPVTIQISTGDSKDLKVVATIESKMPQQRLCRSSRLITPTSQQAVSRATRSPGPLPRASWPRATTPSRSRTARRRTTAPSSATRARAPPAPRPPAPASRRAAASRRPARRRAPPSPRPSATRPPRLPPRPAPARVSSSPCPPIGGPPPPGKIATTNLSRSPYSLVYWLVHHARHPHHAYHQHQRQPARPVFPGLRPGHRRRPAVLQLSGAARASSPALFPLTPLCISGRERAESIGGLNCM